jgi:23S rRNA (guanosine2251-2'-O)-methyltransferase
MIIYGIHTCRTVVEANKENIIRVYLQKNKQVPEWIDGIKQSKISYIDELEIRKLLPKDAVHQGIVIELEPFQYGDITDLVSSSGRCVIAILDGVTDPHNLGAIIRTAAAFGIRGIILTEKSSCKINGVVAKTASGGLEHVTVYIAKNLAQTIEKIKTYGFWVVALCEDGDKNIDELDLSGKICLILGDEGAGIRRLQREKSDFIARLPTSHVFQTLNVSASAAIAFYETSKNCEQISNCGRTLARKP